MYHSTFSARRAALLVGLAGGAEREIAPAVGRRLRAVRGLPVLAVAVEHRLGAAEPGEERCGDVFLLGQDLGRGGRGHGHPDGRVRLLVGARPDVDLAVVEIASLPVERPVMGGPRLHDQVVRLPHAVGHPHRVRVLRRQLERHAADEAALEPAARNDVDHRHLLGDARRLAPVGQRVAQHQDAGVLGDARQDRRHQRHRRHRAGGGLVVLVQHDVQAELVGDLPLVDAVVVDVGALDRIVVRVREDHPDVLQRVGRRQVRIGGFAEMIDSHDVFLSLAAPQRAKSVTSFRKASGCSMLGAWPAASTWAKRAPGISLAICWP